MFLCERSEELKASVEKKLCETFLTLGEDSLENENYAQAVEDLNLCLDRQKVFFTFLTEALAIFVSFTFRMRMTVMTKTLLKKMKSLSKMMNLKSICLRMRLKCQGRSC